MLTRILFDSECVIIGIPGEILIWLRNRLPYVGKFFHGCGIEYSHFPYA